MLVLYYEHMVATMVLLELCFQRNKKTGIDPRTLRVQAPLYRQGPGYMFSSGRLAVGSTMAVTLH
jgi:hypothetical protein